jgi:hypothetical protein
MFLIVFPEGPGVANNKMIGDLEKFLIQVAVAKNPGLRNVRGVREARWGIRGILRSGPGTATKASGLFKSAMDIRQK